MEIKTTHIVKRKKDLKLSVFTFIGATFATLLAIVSVCNGDACDSLDKQDWPPAKLLEFIDQNSLPMKHVYVKDEGEAQCNSKQSCLEVVKSMKSRDVDTKYLSAIDCNFIIDGIGGVYEERGWKYQSDTHSTAVVICFIKPTEGPYPSEEQKSSFEKLMTCGGDSNYLTTGFFTNTKRSLSEGETNPAASLQDYLNEKFGCPAGFYGRVCNEKCSSKCKSRCTGPKGHCTECGQTGMKLPKCKTPCDINWGDGCMNKCSEGCHQQRCNPFDGTCQSCVPGYEGQSCEAKCSNGMYGQDCAFTCSEKCGEKQCNVTNGACLLCPAGMYGSNCAETCSEKCADQICNIDDGSCVHCKPGFSGTECDTECSSGTYGSDCIKSCSKNCVDDKCKPDDGSCACKPGFEPPTCETKTKSPGKSPEKPPGKSPEKTPGKSPKEPPGETPSKPPPKEKNGKSSSSSTPVACQLPLLTLCAMCSLVVLYPFPPMSFI